MYKVNMIETYKLTGNMFALKHRTKEVGIWRKTGRKVQKWMEEKGENIA